MKAQVNRVEWRTARKPGRLTSTHCLVVALSAALQACAHRPAMRDVVWPSARIEETAPKPVRPAPKLQSNIEGHRFTVAKDEGVVGSLGAVQLRDGDTLSDVARHFGLGYEEISAANPGIDPWVPPHGTKAVLPLRFVLPRAPRRGIVINLAAMRLFYYSPQGNEVVTYPVGIGKEGRSTPLGGMSIARKKVGPAWYPTANIRNDHAKRGDPLPAMVPPGPDNPLGAYAMYLSVSPYIIHGTNKPYSIGLRASNGCIRLYPENIERLFPTVNVKEAVAIVNQPYLVGWHDGVLYLQAHTPHEELNEAALQKALRAELKKIEAEKSKVIDWTGVEQILTEARGIPVPISGQTAGLEGALASATQVAHPGTFYGQPERPSEQSGAWHVFAADTASEMSARRMAAVLNHQGPPIPARALEKGERYQVIAGPFADAKAAKAAAQRLKVDLELDGQIIAPDSALAGAEIPAAIPAAKRSEAPVTTTLSPGAASGKAEWSEWSSTEPRSAAPEPAMPELDAPVPAAMETTPPVELPTDVNSPESMVPAPEATGNAFPELPAPDMPSAESGLPESVAPDAVSNDGTAPEMQMPEEASSGAGSPETSSRDSVSTDIGFTATSPSETEPLDLTVPETLYGESGSAEGTQAPAGPTDTSLEVPPVLNPPAADEGLRPNRKSRRP